MQARYSAAHSKLYILQTGGSEALTPIRIREVSLNLQSKTHHIRCHYRLHDD